MTLIKPMGELSGLVSMQHHVKKIHAHAVGAVKLLNLTTVTKAF